MPSVAAALVAAGRATARPGGGDVRHGAPDRHPTGRRWRVAGGHKGRGYVVTDHRPVAARDDAR